jgi:phosphatidylglycerophosphate synthase
VAVRLVAENPPSNSRRFHVIKVSTLAFLTLRYLASNRRPAVVAAISAALVHSRLLARRAHCNWKLRLPALLVSFRAALGLGLVAANSAIHNQITFAVCILAALLSDVYDGVLARRWHIDTEDLRRWDTRADTLFYLCVLVVAVMRYPGAFQDRWVMIAALITAEVVQHVFAAVKYGRHASYHSIISKIWGLMMAGSMIALLGFGVSNWFMDLTLVWGICCNVQGLVMTSLLPTWHRDVPTLFHAIRLRKAVVCGQR